jgi:hypothetical protein
MRRREFITLMGSAAAAWPFPARAQQAAMPVIGYLSGRSPDAEGPLRTPLLAALEEAGFVVRRNVAIEYRFAEGLDERLPMLASDLVRRSVTLLRPPTPPPWQPRRRPRRSPSFLALAWTRSRPDSSRVSIAPVETLPVSAFSRVNWVQNAWVSCASSCRSQA